MNVLELPTVFGQHTSQPVPGGRLFGAGAHRRAPVPAAEAGGQLDRLQISGLAELCWDYPGGSHRAVSWRMVLRAELKRFDLEYHTIIINHKLY